MFTDDIFNESSSVYDDNEDNQNIMSDSFIPHISERKMTLHPNDILIKDLLPIFP